MLLGVIGSLLYSFFVLSEYFTIKMWKWYNYGKKAHWGLPERTGCQACETPDILFRFQSPPGPSLILSQGQV